MQAVLEEITNRLTLPKSTVNGLGIDVGQQETKIVWIEKRSGSKTLKASAIRTPTEINAVVEQGKEDSPISMMGLQTPDPEKERRTEDLHPFRHRKEDSDKACKWQTKDIARLCDRLVGMVGAAFRTSPLHISLSMSVCDFRGVYLRTNGNGIEGNLTDALAESIGNREPRTIAILDQDTSKPKRRVFSLPQETALAFGDNFDRNGMPPMSLDGLPWCLAGCLNLVQNQWSGRSEVDFSGPQIVFDWSWGRPTLVALNGREITYVRRLNHGSVKQLCAQAQDDLDLNNAQAARWLSLCNSTKGDRELMEDTRHWLELRCSELAKELTEAIEYVTWRLGDGQIKNVWLTGGGAALGLDRWIRNGLPCPVHTWTLQSESGNLGPEFATAASLAAKGGYGAI